MKFVVSSSSNSKHLHRTPIRKGHSFPAGGHLIPSGGHLIPSGGHLIPSGGYLLHVAVGGSLFPAPIPLCVSFYAWTIHGLSAQSKDPYFVQDNPWIVQIHTLSLTYIHTYIWTPTPITLSCLLALAGNNGIKCHLNFYIIIYSYSHCNFTFSAFATIRHM